VSLGSPAGECFYVPGNSAGPLLLAGTGTGIAPLLAVARAALAHRHQGPVVVIHGAARPDGLYLGRPGPPALTGPAVSWRTCARSDGQDIAAAVTAELAALSCPPGSVRAYLCGGARSVSRMRRALFMAGMSLADIYADQFVPAGAGS